ncbi:hypothetical protein KDL44_13775 [bacterium]|nr:hypothetical protein [bacterium]
MRPFIAAACLLVCLLLGEAFSQEAPDQTDWADCLSCHAEIASGLPALAPLRPRPNELSPSASCESCHERGIPAFFAGDWSHPVRSVGEHIGCASCHPAVPHDAQHPPPVPEGDYRVEGCYECHPAMAKHEGLLSRHMGAGLTRCIDCHPPHAPLRALLPDPLLTASQRDLRGGYYSYQRSNALCMDCHSGFDLFTELDEGFVTLNTENYHSLHVQRQGIGCIECHDPHAANEHALIRESLLTGELLQYIPDGRGANCTVTCHGARHDALPYVNATR